MNTEERCKYLDPFEELGNAIVLQAVRDYRFARETGDTHLLNECERFFLSEWCAALTRLDGALILSKLQKEKGHKKIKWTIGL